MTSAPRLALWLLARRLPPDQLEFVLGDLEERLQESGSQFWYWRQTLALACRRWPSTAADTRRANGDGWLAVLALDLRRGVRVLRRAPLFSALVVITLGVGLGAAAAIFSVIDPVLLRGAPYPAADRLLLIWGRDEGNEGESNVGWLTFRDVEHQNTTLKDVAVMSYWTPILRGSDASERLMGQRVSHRFFATLDVHPALGRDFRAEEDHAATRRVVILSDGLWRSRFGADPTIVGRIITLSDQSFTVVGVMPKSYESLLAPTAQLWAPLGYEETDPWACRDCQHLRMIGRLKDGIAPEVAQAELNRISDGLVREYPNAYPMAGFVLVSLNHYLTRDVKPVLFATAAAVALLLLIACVNVMNLFLGRAARRTGEFALRTALGAGTAPLIRQVLAESVVLALAGSALALTLAYAAVQGLLQLAPAGLPRLNQVAVNLDVLGFTLLVAILAGIGAGLVPAFAALGANLGTLLRQGGRNIAGTGRRIRTALVVAEVALALMLLTGAGLLLRSLERLLAVDPGFDPRGLVTLELEPFSSRYDSTAAITRYYQTVSERVGALPGVSAVAAVTQLPLSGDYDSWGVHLQSRPSDNPAEDPSAFRFSVTSGYRSAMGIPLLKGRDLSAADDANAPPVLLINEAMARRLFPGQDPLGERIKIGGMDGPWRTVVGVVGDVHHQSLDTNGELEMYAPSTQAAFAETRMVLVVRGNGLASELVPTIRQAILEVDPSVAIATVATMTEHIQTRTAIRRFALMVFQVFAVVALLLAALGLYGVLAGSVTERTREIGIRSALGASQRRLVGLVISHALGLALIGVGLGLAGALSLTGLLRSMLFEVTPTDPVTFTAVAVLLLVVALAAASIPAWRAARVDPADVLRQE